MGWISSQHRLVFACMQIKPMISSESATLWPPNDNIYQAPLQ